MSRYVIVTPNLDNPHIRCFDFVKLALGGALEDLGHSVSFENRPQDDAINVLIGYHLYNRLPQCKGKIIVYQLEQIPRMDLLAQADEIWEMSKFNAERMESDGITVHHVPIGFHPSMIIATDPVTPFRPIFYGSINARRSSILSEIKYNGYGIKTLFNVYGKRLVSDVFMAGLVINCHYYNVALTEQPRLSFLIANQVPFVTEASEDDPWPGVPMHVVKEHPDMAEYVLSLTDDELMSMAQESFNSYRDNFSYNNILANVTS